MIAYDCLDVLHAAIPDLIVLLPELLFLGKCVSIRCKTDWPILVLRFLLCGGLKHVTFLCFFVVFLFT